ncbi:MAG: DUF4105 domain-containing protein [Spirochaetaceae bacterium]|jgi:hypothetical protein|nr:DUF4105 domain-containing protein [Spirochaetaceae bacterium]
MKAKSKICRAFIFTALFFSVPCFLFSTEAEPLKNRGDYLNIKLAVIGPGDELYFWWGHLGLLVEDELSGNARFYDYGVFTFRSDNFISNFALGRLWYTTIVSNASDAIAEYVASNRDITFLTLNLSNEQKLEFLRLTENNIRPENRDYLYNHFSDNCVTRILNNIDTVLDGAFYRAAKEQKGRFTLRGHVRRHTARHPFADWLLNFWMGQVIDKKISAKEEMFLPSEVERFASGFNYTDANGKERPLISKVEKAYISDRPPVLEAPWNNIPFAVCGGIIIAFYFIFSIFIAKKDASLGLKLYGAGNAIFGLLFGIAGSLLFFMEFWTNHDYTFENSNVIFANPLLLTAVPFGIMLALADTGKKAARCRAVLRVLWTYVFLAALLALIIKILPEYYQENLFVILVFLPVAFIQSSIPVLLKWWK